MINHQLMHRWQMELHNEVLRVDLQCVGRCTLYNVRWTWIWFSRCLQLCVLEWKAVERHWWILGVDSECFMWIKWCYVLEISRNTSYACWRWGRETHTRLGEADWRWAAAADELKNIFLNWFNLFLISITHSQCKQTGKLFVKSLSIVLAYSLSSKWLILAFYWNG